MRRKPVLSHSPLLFPTIPAILVSVLVPAYFSQAMAQNVITSKPEEAQAASQQQNQLPAQLSSQPQALSGDKSSKEALP
ncbi:MAG: hypothetical protein HYR68_05085, partial [Burkholderiales bacterium]|nr:hypothetical protein [Burkholderiales bacterium]